jgi:hypothetical protein
MERTAKYVHPQNYKSVHRPHHFRPKRRHLILAEYIEACLDENTLLDENGAITGFQGGGLVLILIIEFMA